MSSLGSPPSVMLGTAPHPPTLARLAPTVRVLDLDGSVTGQSRLLAGCDAQIVDAQDIGPRLRYLATRGAVRFLERRLDTAHCRRLTLTGSGDFHHVTASLLRAFERPFSLVVFDTHPDWDRRSPWPCCGSWVLEALRLPHVHKIVLIGLGDVDIRGWHVNVGPVSQIRSGRVAFYPYDYPRSRTGPGREQSVHCARFQRRGACSDVFWNTVRDNDWGTLIGEIVTALPTDDVYVSVDKDCLTSEYATTNWEPGGLTLAQVCDGVSALRRRKTIVGADITGEWSPVRVASPLFRALLRADHPAMSAPGPERLDRNEATNAALLAAFGLGGDGTHGRSD